MKKLLWIGLIILLLSGCAGLPEPEGSGSSLVIGFMELDFPNGFFSLSPNPTPKTFNSKINLTILNTTTDQSFTTSTSSGYFYFLSNGSDSYKLESYEFVKEIPGAGIYTTSRYINFNFTPVPGNLVYLGDFSFTYAEPDQVSKKKEHSTWNYEVSLELDYNTDSMLKYLREKNPDSSWLSHELFVIESQKK